MSRDSLKTLSGEFIHDQHHQRHWSPASEHFASADVLIGYLNRGWIPDDVVTIDTHFFGSRRHATISIYSFVIRYGNAMINLPVLANPIVLRVIGDYRLSVRALTDIYGNTVLR